MKNFLSFFVLILATMFTSVSAQEYTYTPYTAGSYNYGPYYNSDGYSEYNYGPYSYENSYANDGIVVEPEGFGSDAYSDERDSVRAAKAYAQNFWEEYVVDLTYPDGKGGWNFMQVGMNLQGQVFEVILNKKYVIKREEGILLPGIPLPKGGMRDAYIYVDGVVNDEPKVNGSAYYEHIRNGDRIQILLRPRHLMEYIDFSLDDIPAIPDNVDPFDIRLMDQAGNWVGYYYPWLGGFVLWVDPSRSPFYASVYIEGYSGNFGSILIDPLKQTTQKFKGASFDFNLLGNVVRVSNHSGNQSYKMDGTTVDKNGNLVKTKTFIYQNPNLNNVNFWVSAKAQHCNVYLDVEVFNVTDGDELVFKRTFVPNQQLVFDQFVELPASENGWENIVVVFTTRNGDLQNDDLDFYLYETYGSGPVYNGEIEVSGFQDQGSTANNDDNTSRDYTFSFEVEAEGGDVKIVSSDVDYFVEGSGAVSSSYTVDSTAEEINGGFVVREGGKETFTVVVTLSGASVSGQYRVGLSSVNGVDVDETKFRTVYRTINSSGKG